MDPAIPPGTSQDRPPSRAEGRKPPWLKVPLAGGEGWKRLRRLTRSLELNTVCEEARCPNLGECWRGEHATMTVMVLGDECTRRCRFCAVRTAEAPPPPDPREPERVARALEAMGVGYAVLTSVNRDDLPDEGAGHFAECVRRIRERAPGVVVETLIPDWRGEPLAALMEARPDVLGHNVEVVPRLQRRIRDPRCSFERSLETLRGAKAIDPGALTKSSLMLGLGESREEAVESMERLREAEVDLLTLGQYLRPSKKHAPVVEYVTPERFDELGALGESLGFRHVASGPRVRSSYRAGELFAEGIVRARPGPESRRSSP